MNTGTVGVLLAGGMARRMGGGDKSLLELEGQRILDWVISRARPQVDALVLNANGDPDRFRECNLPVASDVIGDFAGPLAGILTGTIDGKLGSMFRCERSSFVVIATSFGIMAVMAASISRSSECARERERALRIGACFQLSRRWCP